jgi:hypothetical protein
MSSDGNTWLGYLGGGGSAALIVGGGIFQFDLWNLGGTNLPTRVYVTSKKVGLMAHAGLSHAMVLVVGAKNQTELEGIKSGGIDWEFDIGASAKALKGVAKFQKYADLFAQVEKLATVGGKGVRTMTNWAGHETAKRLVDAAQGELGVVQSPGPQFNILPSPMSVGIGAGIAYDWQTMHTMGGKNAWSMISPGWFVENGANGVVLQMYNIPEQDGTWIDVAIGINEWGSDPYIRFKSGQGGPTLGSNAYHVRGYVWNGWLWQTPKSGSSGIELGALTPIGQLETGMVSVSNTNTVNKNATIKIYPVVIHFGNMPYWSAGDSTSVTTDGSARLKKALNPGKALG